MRPRRYRWAKIAAFAILAMGISACGDDEESSVEPATFDLESCLTRWDAAYSARFNAGETYFLPSLSTVETARPGVGAAEFTSRKSQCLGSGR